MTILPNISNPVTPDPFLASGSLTKSLSRLNAGSRAASADSASPGPAANTSLVLTAQMRGLDQTQQQVGNALSFTQTQQAYLETISSAFDKMSGLAGLAQNGDVPDAQRSQYESEFSQLQSIVANSAAQEFNGLPLFSGDALDVAVEPGGTPVTLPGLNLNQAPYNAVLQAGLNSPDQAQAAIDSLQSAASRLQVDRAGINENQARLSAAADRLAVSRENVNAAASGIRTADAAEESVQFARDNFVGQSGAAIRAQANAMPQRALRLLP